MTAQFASFHRIEYGKLHDDLRQTILSSINVEWLVNVILNINVIKIIH